MKVVERIFELKIPQQIEVDDMQFGFVKGKGTIDSIFTTWRSYASAVLGVVILSVCPSLCHMHALWRIRRTYRQYFYTTWKGNPSSFLPPNSGWWATSSST